MSSVSLAAYRGLLAEPALRRLAIADACARLPQGMVSITLLLVAAEHASMAAAGLVVAGYTLGQAVTGPVRGRLADRYGLIPVLALALAFALALAAAATAMAGARTIAGHAPVPFGRKEPEGEVRRELVDTAARARRGGRHGVVSGRRHRGADR